MITSRPAPRQYPSTSTPEKPHNAICAILELISRAEWGRVSESRLSDAQSKTIQESPYWDAVEEYLVYKHHCMHRNICMTQLDAVRYSCDQFQYSIMEQAIIDALRLPLGRLKEEPADEFEGDATPAYVNQD